MAVVHVLVMCALVYKGVGCTSLMPFETKEACVASLSLIEEEGVVASPPRNIVGGLKKGEKRWLFGAESFNNEQAFFVCVPVEKRNKSDD